MTDNQAVDRLNRQVERLELSVDRIVEKLKKMEAVTKD